MKTTSGVTHRAARGAFDVVVVGAGPAGAATAIALAQRGLTAAIVEPSAAPVLRAGETVSPAVRAPLEALGVWEAFAGDGHDPAAGNRAHWGSPEAGEMHFIASPYRSGWHIDRRRFETMLLGAARARGVTIFHGHQLEAVSEGGDGWTVRIPGVLRARFLVDASGRASALAPICGVDRVSIDRLVGATMFLQARERSSRRRADPDGLFTVVEATQDGWWYSAPLPQGRLVVACMTDADIATRVALRDADGWLAQARGTRATIDRIASYVLHGTPRLAPANTSRLSSVVGPSWLAVGDAAVSFDPLSSQGIVTALECAVDAAGAIGQHLCGHRSALPAYALRITKVYRKYLVERAQYYGAERRWSTSAFWQRRQAHIEVLNHATAS